MRINRIIRGDEAGAPSADTLEEVLGYVPGLSQTLKNGLAKLDQAASYFGDTAVSTGTLCSTADTNAASSPEWLSASSCRT